MPARSLLLSKGASSVFHGLRFHRPDGLLTPRRVLAPAGTAMAFIQAHPELN